MDFFHNLNHRSEDDSRFVFFSGPDAPAPAQAEQPEGNDKAPEQKDKASSPEEVDQPIRQKAMDSLDRSLARMKALIEMMASSKAKKEYISDAEDTIGDIKKEVEHVIESGMKPEKLMGELEQHLVYVEKKLEMRLQVDKLISDSPVMKKLYDQIKGQYYGLAEERLLISIDNIFNEEKDPDTALRRAQGEMMKEEVLGDYSDAPAKPDGLANRSNSLGREQMEQVFKLLNINFDSLDLSADQINKLRTVSSVRYEYKGATYLEMELLDKNGNVQKAGLERLFNHGKEVTEDDPERAERFRRRFARRSGVSLALQTKAQEKYGKSGKLPNISIDGRSFDLNKIAAENEQEYARFAKVSTVKELLNFRFDEAVGADERAENELPPEVKKQLEALGMKDPDILTNRGRVRRIEFKYKGEKVSLSIGKAPWGDSYDPHLHIFNGNQRINSRKVDLDNLTEELDEIHKYKTENQPSIDKINSEYFGITNDKIPNFSSIYPEMRLLYAKEIYLGSLVQPDTSDKESPNPKTVKALEKILPMILANAKALGISDDMSLMEAMLKVYQSPKRDELLTKNYSATLNDMKKSDHSHYAGVKPEYKYRYDAADRKATIESSRTSTDPDYLERKEQMEKMKPGDQMEVKFEGEKYKFTLVSSFANYQYRFKIEGFEGQSDFKIDNVNLVKRSPEKQLQYMLGSHFRRASMGTERLLQGKIKPENAPKRISVDWNFAKGKLPNHRYFKNLPLSDKQRQLLEDINKNDSIKLTMNTDKYGKITYCDVKWQDPASKTHYRLRSSSGNYWRLSTLKDKSSRTNYPFYDIETQYVGARVENLKKGASA